MKNETIIPSRKIRIEAKTFSLLDVKNIYKRLAIEVDSQATREINELQKPADKSEDDFEKLKKDARKAFRVTVTITGVNDKSVEEDSLWGDSEDVFDSPNIPERISSIYMSNKSAYRSFANVEPNNNFELFLDFLKPPLIDHNNFISSPTPNASSLDIHADNNAWIGAINEAVFGILDKRKNRRSLLHRGSIYDIGLFFPVLPIAIYFCWSLSTLIENHLGTISKFLSSIIYIYLVFLTMWFYRILFGYTRWAFPSIELSDKSKSEKYHRRFWNKLVSGIIISLIASLLWQTLIT